MSKEAFEAAKAKLATARETLQGLEDACLQLLQTWPDGEERLYVMALKEQLHATRLQAFLVAERVLRLPRVTEEKAA